MEKANPDDDGGVSVMTRVFIGGLGQSVTTIDLEKTFSSFGRVKSLEIVRTNGRSFGYMDFEYDSPKSLHKLFSTYNGCIWRGGRLRLEKAKEHYMIRLQREWAEDGESKKVLSTNTKPDTDESGISKRSVRLREEKMQLNIYFPRLNKVKLLPYAGTGKHKYSFQHVNPPPLPIHFCDCEEHCLPTEGAQSHVNLESVDNVIGKYEVDIMNSVMEKIFKREAIIESGSKEHNSSERNDASQLTHTSSADNEEVAEASDNEEAADASDSDNLVTNIALDGGEVSSGVGRDKQLMFTSEPLPNNRLLTRHKLQNHDGSTLVTEPASTKKQRMFPADNGKEKQSRKGQISTHHSNDLVYVPEAQTTEARAEEEADTSERNKISPAISEIPPVQASISSNWVQTASFKDLVSGKSNSTFKLSDVFQLPSANKEEIPRPREAKKLKLNDFKHRKKGDVSGQKLDDLSKGSSAELSSSALQFEKAEPKVTARMSKETDALLSNTNIKESEASEMASRDASIGDVCTFMRSAESQKQWAKARAVVKASMKRKGTDSSAAADAKTRPRRR